MLDVINWGAGEERDSTVRRWLQLPTLKSTQCDTESVSYPLSHWVVPKSRIHVLAVPTNSAAKRGGYLKVNIATGANDC